MQVSSPMMLGSLTDRRISTSLTTLKIGPGGSPGGQLLDDLDCDSVHVPHPEGQSNHSAGSSPEDPAHLEL